MALSLPEYTAEFTVSKNQRLQPKVSIIIPVLNQLDMTRQCIGSIQKHTQPEHYELLVVNNGSTDGTRAFLDACEDVSAVHCSTNIGVGPAWNLGIEHSRGSFICILNNDILVTPNWLDHLLWPFSVEPNVWCTGPVFTREALPPKFNELAEIIGSSPPRLVSGGIIGFCFVLTREAVNQIGLFDEQFETAWFEDTDYYCRLLEAGHPPATATNCLIHHFETRTARAELPSGGNAILERNKARFIKKWGRIFDPGVDTIYSLPFGDVILRFPAQGTYEPGR